MDDPFHLQRFVDAQDDIYETALCELRQGRKQTHWMWFVFPQIAGLGHSSMTQRFAITGRDEARAYMGHPVLGPRLEQSCQAVNAVRNRTAHEIFGTPDDMKFRSSMTLFREASPLDGSVFEQLLGRYFAGEPDPRTLELLG